MTELIALLAAIGLIVVVLLLRAVLALPFPRQRVRFVPARPPAGTESLFEQAGSELAALGFEPAGWLLYERVDGEPGSAPLRAVFRHRESGSLACLAPPIAPKQAHRLWTTFVSRLTDGRLAVSQAFDAWFENTATDEIVAQTLAEPSLDAQWQAHLAWAQRLGAIDSIDSAGVILDALGASFERQRQTLLQRGALQALSPDLAVPRPAFALRLLHAYASSPSPPPDPRPVAPAGLALLASAVEQVRHRSPPRREQWALFAISVALFMLVGAILWDAIFALTLLVVVLIHELGHFLAMRAFGYRNTHILALPLVGGVAMGVDAHPHATRNAWMSLMGPLPGIVLGWVLLLANLAGGVPEAMGEWAMAFAIALLLVNYLNVLPIPPLDGAHVVQALLPQRLARLRTVFIAVACVLGAVLAWQLGFALLVALPLLQLMTVPAQWQLHRVEDELAKDQSLRTLHPNARLLRVFQTMERVLGPTPHAAARVEQGLQLARTLRTEPMSTPARLVTGSVLAGLLVVPVVGLLAFALWGSGPLGLATADGEAWEWSTLETELRSEAGLMQTEALLIGLSSGGAPRSPVGSDALAAAEARLGAALPNDLAELYALSDGTGTGTLLPLADVARAEAFVTHASALGMLQLTLFDDEGTLQETTLDTALLRRWWQIGGELDYPLLYDPAAEGTIPGVRLLSIDLEEGTATTHASLRAWLESEWPSRVLFQRMEAARAASEAAHAQALADVPMEKLIESFEQPGLLIRLLLGAEDLPGPAAAEAVDAVEQRLSQGLPTDYRALLELHNGFPPLELLPVEEVARWRTRQADMSPDALQWLLEDAESGSAPSAAEGAADGRVSGLTQQSLADCLILAATRFQVEDYDSGLTPRLVLCPDLSTHPGVIDLRERRRYDALRPWMVAQAARQRAWLDQVE